MPSQAAKQLVSSEPPISAASIGHDETNVTVAQQCAQLLSVAKDVAGARSVLNEARALAARHPDVFQACYTNCLIHELVRIRIGMLERWSDLHERFPESQRALRYRLRWLARSHRADEGRPLIEHRYAAMAAPLPLDSVLEQADLFSEIRDHQQATILYEHAIETFPASTLPRQRYSRRLADRGDLVAALEVLAPLARSETPPKPAVDLHAGLSAALDVLRRVFPEEVRKGENLQPLALRHAIERFQARQPRSLPTTRIGPTAFITGSLGPGGAERQLARTAVEFNLARRAKRRLNGVQLDGPIHIVVRSLCEEDRNDFFLAMVTEAEVITDQLDCMKVSDRYLKEGADATLGAVLPFLTGGAIFGLRRLVDFFLEAEIDVAFIWQDGAVLMASLAALIAGVPRIVISLRGQPSVVRAHRHNDNYLAMYRALAAVPGVEFLTNNNAAAEAYCSWLGISRERFSVVPNGVSPLSQRAGLSDAEAWTAFAARTKGATKTIGGVFRFDLDKNPLAWIRFAKLYLSKDANARFVLVGAGRLHMAAQQLAEELGIADRILFTGVSSVVGFWLSKMDVLVLLSRFEGLPNVLIEAQLAGVGVVSTPAGGACEAFIPGRTGVLLSSAHNPDPEEICGAVDLVETWQRRSPFLRRWMQQYAAERFAVPTMVGRMAMALSGTKPDETPAVRMLLAS